MNIKSTHLASSPLRRTLYTAPKFFDASGSTSYPPPVPSTSSSPPSAHAHGPRNGLGRGKPEFIVSATMSGVHTGSPWDPSELHGGAVRGWESRRDNRRKGLNRMTLNVGGYGIPKKGHVMDGASTGGRAVQVGEDAYFVRRNAMGVADGVGGWAKSKGKEREELSGSAIFANRLMSAAAEELEKLESLRPSEFLWLFDNRWQSSENCREPVDVLLVLENAYAKAIQPVPPPGSSTALLAVLSPTPPPSPYAFLVSPPQLEGSTASLRIVHVGDCMAMVIRDATVVFRSTEMWWAFNTPVQLGPDSPLTTNPAQTFSVPVQEGDLVILATDGLSDNLWDDDVLDEVHKWAGEDVSVLSEALCSRARSVAKDAGADTPFARRAREEGKRFSGGKKDDVSVVVALIAERTT